VTKTEPSSNERDQVITVFQSTTSRQGPNLNTAADLFVRAAIISLGALLFSSNIPSAAHIVAGANWDIRDAVTKKPAFLAVNSNLPSMYVRSQLQTSCSRQGSNACEL
jgi:hypothetical protein